MTETEKLEFIQSKIDLPRGGSFGVITALSPKHITERTCLIIAHGAGGPMYSPFITFFHKAMAERGYLAVKFNFPYMEARRKVPDKKEILEASYRTLIETVKNSKYHPKRVFVGGKSMGGRIASQVVAAGEDVDGLFFLGYPLHRPGQPDMLRDEHLYRIERPMLFISGTKDQFARQDLLDHVVTKLGRKAEIHWIEDGDHSFNTRQGKDAQAKIYEGAITTLDTWVKVNDG